MITSRLSYACGRSNHQSCGKYGCECYCHREQRLKEGGDKTDKTANVITRLQRVRDTYMTRYKIAQGKAESLRKTNHLMHKTYAKEAEEERLYAEAIETAIKALTK